MDMLDILLVIADMLAIRIWGLSASGKRFKRKIRLKGLKVILLEEQKSKTLAALEWEGYKKPVS